MKPNSLLLSYSKSTPFRSALLKLNFSVGKTFIENIDMGTIASLDKNKIDNPLSDYDLELINTRSGIPYRDKSLNLTKEAIIQQRNIEQKNSTLLSHTQFIKNNAKIL